MGEGDGVGTVEGSEVDLAHADAETHGDEGSEQLAVTTGMERGRGQLVPPLLWLIVDKCQVTHLPDEIVVGFFLEP